MAEPKTTRTDADVASFIASVADDTRRSDAEALVALFQEATGEAPAMWGPAIIGFGSCRTVSDAGRESTFMRLGFSPRAKQTSIYILTKPPTWNALLERLGPHTLSTSCLYVKRVSDIDPDVLRELVADGWNASRAKNPDADD